MLKCRTEVRPGSRPNKCRDGFTLLELMVVIAIMVILLSILAPSVMGARECVLDARCKASLKHLADALRLHHQSAGAPDAWSWLQAAEEIDVTELTFCPLGGFESGGSHVPAITGGAVTSIAAPASVVFNDYESNDRIHLFTEKQNYVLPTNVTVDISEPGYYSNNYGRTSKTIPAGTAVDCYFVFYDPVGRQEHTVNGSLQMAGDILGLICLRGSLDRTDPSGVLGLSGTKYPTGRSARNFENNAERVTLEDDMRTIVINRFHSTYPGENMRVLTRPSPGGAGSFAMNSQVSPTYPRPDQIFLMDYNSAVVYPRDPWHITAMEDMRDEGRLHMGKHINAAMTDGSVMDFTPDELGPDNPHW